ncbi:30S ribosomal protein S13 [Candidatus Saccharibacteria bacterium]|nr:30S ribosomal protein S13 [Candidatus Saccharibacteria bacterium]
MARIANITLPNDKQIYIGLTAVYGIGINTAKKILNELKIDTAKRVKDLTAAEEQKLNEYIAAHMTVEGNLQRIVQGNIKRLKDVNAYRGLRHKSGLPVRGQRTRTNARTRKGRAIAVGGAQPKAASKT